MKRKYILLLLSMCSCFLLFAQDKGNTDIDFVICINGDIAKTIYRPQIVVSDSESATKSLSISYHPGSLFLEKADLNYLLSLDDDKKILLKFDYYQQSTKGEQKVNNYEIDMGKEWLRQKFMILYIYDTDRKEYKGKIKPIKGRCYTFELDYPGGQMIRLRQR
ncbi:hypothetical protein RYH73_26365 [Olivibacter sp. CPCC 100613]|uniref:hypothetical protein n=1 Tax=Olivibacter sp. CPCC 100613 TaxID=3079931 RepID=UPI002FFC5512